MCEKRHWPIKCSLLLKNNWNSFVALTPLESPKSKTREEEVLSRPSTENSTNGISDLDAYLMSIELNWPTYEDQDRQNGSLLLNRHVSKACQANHE